MKHLNTDQARFDITRHLPVNAVSPRTKPLRLLVLGRSSGNSLSILDRLEDETARGLGMPVRVTFLNPRPHMRTALPRGIPWKEFPVVSAPWWSFTPVNKKDGLFNMDGMADTGIELSEVLDAHDGYVFDDWNAGAVPSKRHLDSYKVGYLLSRLADATKPIWTATSSGEMNGGKAYIRSTAAELMFNAAGTARFHYSYRVNFAAVAMKAVRSALGCAEQKDINNAEDFVFEALTPVTSDGPEYFDWWASGAKSGLRRERSGQVDCWASDANRDLKSGLTPRGLDHPLALQMLYALRRKGEVDASRFFGSKLEEDPLRELFQIDNYDRRWIGTGKHAPLTVTHGRRDSAALAGLGLIEFTTRPDGGVVRLSEGGEKFLSLLHPDCEDPDCVLRWTVNGTGCVAAGYEKEVDAWMMRFFRKMKTKVNAIS